MPAEHQPQKSEKPATARVFFALWPPAGVADRLAAIAGEAAARFGGRATRRETIHLTLAFLGDVAASRLTELGAAAAGVQAAPFTLSIDRLGCWSHNHLLWAGCEQPAAALGELQANLEKALAEAGFRVFGEGRGFAPHVTLVRRIPPGVEPGVFAPALPSNGLAWPCRHFVLVRSQPTASGSEYLVLREFSL